MEVMGVVKNSHHVSGMESKEGLKFRIPQML
ncbi:hypothetical protein CODIS_33890 [Candidatus Thiodiazotropha endolucinida]|uniref:Uncharacterized protein n=1 Tax=Candidatus Thiodiazotropha endolucinida TaxID=1655433 RepID=A0A7Z0VJ04_9GAMM|nr:hypothetical protein CODIS_33890 [Candidatus Thiodiazotropha endolucinida]